MLTQAVTAIALTLWTEAPESQHAPALQRLRDSTLAVAESLLAGGRLADARRIAERLEDRNPNDPRVLTLLGRIHLAWPVTGRFAAESLLRRAGALAPDDPAPFYWLGHVGLTLGGDDGESIARRGLLRVLALDPTYRDAWHLWSRLYAGSAERRAAIEALARHAGTDPADGYRAQLLADLGAWSEAQPLLETLARRHPGDVAPLVLLSRGHYEQGRDHDGWTWYQRALESADLDTGQVLWRQVRSIATPAERELWRQTTPAQRAAFFRVFWARREPNLFAAGNERLGEHFRRMAQARRDYRVLHPNARFHRSPLYRELMGVGGTGPELASTIRRAQHEQCSSGPPDSLISAQYQRQLQPLVDPGNDTSSPNIEDGLDDRGRIWVRHGRPTTVFIYGLDGETWCYERPGGTFRVTFARRTGYGGVGGDVIVTPVQPGEVESARALLTTDRPGQPYRLDFEFWHAAFRGADGLHTDLYLFPDSARAIATLLGEDGYEAARDSAADRYLHIEAPPGHYLLLLDALRDGRLGSYRGPMPLPAYGGGNLALSSLLVAAGDVAPERLAMAAAAPAGLRLPARVPMRLYAEIYGLGRVNGESRYQARYRFTRLDGPRAQRGRETVVSFQRDVPFDPRVIETLVVDPGRLAPGRYRVRLEILDQIRATTLAGAAMEILLH